LPLYKEGPSLAHWSQASHHVPLAFQFSEDELIEKWFKNLRIETNDLHRLFLM
jgi:hypothetical protein